MDKFLFIFFLSFFLISCDDTKTPNNEITNKSNIEGSSVDNELIDNTTTDNFQKFKVEGVYLGMDSSSTKKAMEKECKVSSIKPYKENGKLLFTTVECQNGSRAVFGVDNEVYEVQTSGTIPELLTNETINSALEQSKQLYGQPDMIGWQKSQNKASGIRLSACWGDCIEQNKSDDYWVGKYIDVNGGRFLHFFIDSNPYAGNTTVTWNLYDEALFKKQKESHKQNSISTSNGFTNGDPVFVLYAGNRKCKATVISKGNKQTKVEFNEWCEIGLANHKSNKDEEWVPNNALVARDL